MSIYPESDHADHEADTSAESPLTDQVSTDETQSAAPLAEKKTPDQWAEVCFAQNSNGQMHDDAWKHAAASALHGWWECERVTGKPMQLSAADYYQALVAASGTKFEPHEAARFNHKGAV